MGGIQGDQVDNKFRRGEKLITKTIKIVNQHGLHMRPCCQIVDVAEAFDSDIKISKEGEEPVNAKSVMGLSMLAVLIDEEVTITATGDDEIEAVDAIVELIENGFPDQLVEK